MNEVEHNLNGCAKCVPRFRHAAVTFEEKEIWICARLWNQMCLGDSGSGKLFISFEWRIDGTHPRWDVALNSFVLWMAMTAKLIGLFIIIIVVVHPLICSGGGNSCRAAKFLLSNIWNDFTAYTGWGRASIGYYRGRSTYEQRVIYVWRKCQLRIVA